MSHNLPSSLHYTFDDIHNLDVISPDLDEIVFVYRDAGPATVTVSSPVISERNWLLVQNLSSDRAALLIVPSAGSISGSINLSIPWPRGTLLIWDGTGWLAFGDK